ncbi:hypothetical protein HNR00_002196 [Methylorubrum rhodinum]|uniref:Uncharacterized protein n=1 Tax=Methylorubrum rhodinum TaxID=29428 RepID=A0A840ZKY9_9HYPH|nr:hypothetical protein [Methylorubrum rhodinum]MBB5757483.1 hypothetical protein [Methylorubrum rhodinum]
MIALPLRRGLRAACLALLAAAPAQAGPLAAGPDCGPDAFSSAEVIEHRPPRRGPLTAVPQTLCADLAPQAPAPVDIHLYPGLGAPVGRQAPGDPYEGGRRGHTPRP